MAEKTFNVRILNKIDTLERWQASDLKIKNGEICIATVAASAGTGLTEPVCMIKIGTEEEKTFAELPWAFYAKSSDVLAACKSTEALTAFVNNVIANAGIASSEAMTALTGRVTTAEGEIDTLQSEMDAVEAKAAANETAIGTLNSLVGDKKVATQIQEAITALDLANTYEVKGEAAKVQTALNEYKTTNDAAVQKNATDIAGEIARAKAAEEASANAITAIKDGTTIDSFADVETALAGKEASGAAAQALADAKTYADGKDSAMNERVEALEAIDHEHENKTVIDGITAEKVAAWDAAEQNAKDYVDGEIEEWVGDKAVGVQISEAITGLDLANTYAAKEHKHVKADITDFAHTHVIAEVTDLQDALDGKQAKGDYATKTEAQGYADAKDEAIAAAKAAADKAQDEVDALEVVVGTLPEGKTSVIEYINEKTSGIATDTALGELQDAVDAIEADYLKAADKTALQDQITANDGEIAALQGLVGDTKVSTAIENAVKEEADRAKGIEGGLETRLKAVEDDYLKAADKTELTNAIATAKQEAVATVLGEGTSEDFDTLKEVADWILSDTTGAAALQTDVAAIKADYLKAADKTELEGKITAAQNAADKAQGEVDALEGEVATKAAQADHEALAGRVTTVEGKVTTLEGEMDTAQADIDALEGKVGEKKVSVQISEAIAAENLAQYALASDLDTAEGKIEALEADTHTHANKEVLDGIEAADITAWDAKVDSVTAVENGGIKATREGNAITLELDDTITYVFNCGTSVE